MKLYMLIFLYSAVTFGETINPSDLIGTWVGHKKECIEGKCRDLSMEYSISHDEVAVKFSCEEQLFGGGTYYKFMDFLKGKHPGTSLYDHTLKLRGNTLTICDKDGCHDVDRFSNDPHALRKLFPGNTSD